MNNELIEFKWNFAKLISKHGISALNAIDKEAYIGFTPEENNPKKIKDHFTFNCNFIGNANMIPLAYDDEELKNLIGISKYRGAYASEFIEDLKPLLKYYGINSITSSTGGLYSLRWDDGNKFIMENVDLEMIGNYAK